MSRPASRATKPTVIRALLRDHLAPVLTVAVIGVGGLVVDRLRLPFGIGVAVVVVVATAVGAVLVWTPGSRP